MPKISNFTHDEIHIGQKAQYTKQITANDIVLFAAASGDLNPVHLDAEFAATTSFGEPIAHGMLTGAIISAAIAMELPGPGTIYRSQSLRFRLPVKIGDEICVHLEVTEKRDKPKLVTLDCKAINQHGKVVAGGTAEVMSPTEKMLVERANLPEIKVCF
jgi:acyl dehydratase